MDINNLIIVYNAFQVALSAYMFYEVCFDLLLHSFTNTFIVVPIFSLFIRSLCDFITKYAAFATEIHHKTENRKLKKYCPFIIILVVVVVAANVYYLFVV